MVNPIFGRSVSARPISPCFHASSSQLFQLDDVDGTDSADSGDEFLMCQMSLLVPDVSIVHFRLETGVERWQDVD